MTNQPTKRTNICISCDPFCAATRKSRCEAETGHVRGFYE